MNKFEIVKKIENFAPLETQDNWDNSGWLVCTPKKEVSKIMLALTITDKIYEEAKNNNCDMIISHHPLFFIPLKYFDMNMYCAHTNMDKAIGGTTDTLLEQLGLEVDEIQEEYVRIVKLSEPVKTELFTKKIKHIFPNMRYVNNNNLSTIKTIGVCAGSGSEFLNTVKTDAYITGDLKFHTALDTDKVVYDIGHFESEIFILKKFAKILDIEVIYSNEKSPFIYD